MLSESTHTTRPRPIHFGTNLNLLCVMLCRILRLYAEENAIDDTVYYLGEALRKGIVELDVFLKVS